MRKAVTLVIILAVAASGCATARGQGHTVPAYRADPAIMSAYVRQLPVGSRVRVSLADGRVLKGTLIRTDTDPIVVQRRTRIPEAPMQIALADLHAVEIERNGSGSTARSIAIGAAVGAGAALGVLVLLAALFAD